MEPGDELNLEGRWKAFLETRVTRERLLQTAGLGAVAALAPGLAAADTTTGTGSAAGLSFPFYPQVATGRYTTETVQEIVSNILTWAYFEVSAATFILNTAPLRTQLGLTGLPLAFLQAFNAELQAHIDFWSKVAPGAAPKATSFTIDPRLVPGPREAAAVFEIAATIRIGLMLAAVREFAELGQPTLAKYAAQTLGMYAEERGIARVLQALGGVTSAVPPNNKAFETDLFLYTRDAVTALTTLGFVGGVGITVTYPGSAAATSAAGASGGAILQRTPNNATTSVTITGPGSVLAERT